MSNINWQALEQAFAEAADLSATEQRAFLVTLRKKDPALADHLEGMLHADDGNDGPLVAPVTAAVERLQHPWLGQSVGPYVLEAHIASGGMGSVFLARRNDAAFEQTVAVKILSAGVFGDEAQLRFRTERQILANLQHPNIAELYDGGTTGQGLPYLVMEYIDGEPIDEHCQLHTLDLGQRLALFLKVCDAVELAHRNLIVHRDIKPSNILVTPGGEPKLLDFGIAKALAPQADLENAFTQADQRAMTPEYASPEQVLGQPVTTATDVYGLGLLLYKLLSGTLPYDLAGLRASEIEQTICETPPPPPSRSTPRTEPGAMGKMEDQLPPAPETFSPHWRRALTGDLDSIVLCALQKAPEHRYGSVRALADDIRAYLRHLPISAREPVWTYRLQRFVRRHRTAVAFAGLVAVLLVGFSAYSTHQARLLAVEKETAEQSLNYMVSLFRAADPRLIEPGVNVGPDTTVTELFELGSKRVRQELKDQPRVKARLLMALAMAHQSIGNYDTATALYQEALLLQRELGLPAAELAETLNEQGWLLYEQGDYRNADLNITAARNLYRTLGTDHRAAFGETTSNLANVKVALGEIAAAMMLLDEAQTIEQTIYAADDPRLAANMHNRAIMLWEQGAYREALQLEEQAFALWEAHLDADHPSIAAAHNFLATLLLNARGDISAAREHYEKALGITQRTMGASHPDYARDMMDLAQLELEVGNLRRAQDLNRDAVDILRSAFGDDHHYVVIAQLQLIDTELALGETGGVPALLRDVRQAVQANPDVRDHVVASLANLEAQYLHLTGDSTGAQVLIGEALADLTERFTDPPLFRLYHTLLDVQLALEGPAAAAETLQHLRAIAEQPDLSNNVLQIHYLRARAAVSLATNDTDDAANTLDELEAQASQILGTTNLALVDVLAGRAELAQRAGAIEEAKTFRLQAASLLEQIRR